MSSEATAAPVSPQPIVTNVTNVTPEGSPNEEVKTEAPQAEWNAKQWAKHARLEKEYREEQRKRKELEDKYNGSNTKLSQYEKERQEEEELKSKDQLKYLEKKAGRPMDEILQDIIDGKIVPEKQVQSDPVLRQIHELKEQIDYFKNKEAAEIKAKQDQEELQKKQFEENSNKALESYHGALNDMVKSTDKFPLMKFLGDVGTSLALQAAELQARNTQKAPSPEEILNKVETFFQKAYDDFHKHKSAATAVTDAPKVQALKSAEVPKEKSKTLTNELNSAAEPVRRSRMIKENEKKTAIAEAAKKYFNSQT